MMVGIDGQPFRAPELPRVFWSIDRKHFAEGGLRPGQLGSFGAIVELPNGWKAKCEKVFCLGHDQNQYQFMGFVLKMWDGTAKMHPTGGGR